MHLVRLFLARLLESSKCRLTRMFMIAVSPHGAR
jgi:hypothetical protein